MPTVCQLSTVNCRLLDLNSTEQSENVYENKRQDQKVEKSRSRRVKDVEELETTSRSISLVPRRKAADSFSTSHLLNFSTPELDDRSGNVYESKGKGQNVHMFGLRDLHILAHGLTTPTPSTKIGAGAFPKRELRRSFVVPIGAGLLRMTGLGGDLTTDD